MYRIGFDVGGTFTDLVMLEEETGAVVYHKVPSTPGDPSEAIGTGLSDLISRHAVDGSAIRYLGHGTTVATNMVIERRGALTGLITTRGFRDVLEIGRQTRPHLYDLSVTRPAPLIPRHLRLEVDERVLAEGEVLVPLNEAQVEAAARTLAAAGVRAVVICFLHSYRRPEHERRAAEIVQRILPDAYVSISSEVLPEFREFERMSTTTLNAYVGPRMGDYLERLLERTHALGIGGELQTVHSNGGLMSVRAVRQAPVRTCVSGPAAGVIGAVEVGRAAGFENLVTFDVGGTSTDVSVVVRGRPLFASDRLVADHPVKTPMLDIHVIGAGGGSVAFIDDAGGLKVGPRSAGAVPGPAGYGRGGEEPTLTDANIVLGRLNPVALLDGALPVDAAAARKVIEDQIASPLGLSVEEAALGVVRIANANMARAVRSVSTERGHDIRDFALFAYGGAGPLHACELAAECAISTVLVPLEPGTLCARGILLSDIAMDFVRSELSLADGSAWARAQDHLAEMKAEGFAWLEREGVALGQRTLRLMIDARYDGQNYEVLVPVDDLGAEGLDAFIARFRDRHLQEYGYDVSGRPVEIVNYRVQAIGRAPSPPHAAPQPDPGAEALTDRRPVYFGGGLGWVETPVFRRGRLAPGTAFVGPAVVEEMSSTVVVPPAHALRVDVLGNIVISVKEASPNGQG